MTLMLDHRDLVEATRETDLALIVEARAALKSGRGERLRRNAGLSLAEVAAAVGVSKPTVWRWEAGSYSPRGDAACAYARVLRFLEREQRTVLDGDDGAGRSSCQCRTDSYGVLDPCVSCEQRAEATV